MPDIFATLPVQGFEPTSPSYSPTNSSFKTLVFLNTLFFPQRPRPGFEPTAVNFLSNSWPERKLLWGKKILMEKLLPGKISILAATRGPNNETISAVAKKNLKLSKLFSSGLFFLESFQIKSPKLFILSR